MGDLQYELNRIPGQDAVVYFVNTKTRERLPIQTVDIGNDGNVELLYIPEK